MNIDQFIAKYLGKQVDFDGAYGGQCVDLFRQYNKEVLNIPQPKGVTGAADFWSNHNTDVNLSASFIKISNTPDFIPIAGDVMIWTRKYGPYGHIAIVTKADINQFTCFSQNDPTGQPCILKTYKYTNVYGVLRPKVLITTGTMPENTNLQKVLTYYKVKTTDELIKMVDEQLKFLADERKTNAGLSETIKTLQDSHTDFVENLLTTLNPMGNPLGLSDEELVKKLVVEAVKVETDLQSKLKESEKAAAERERLLKQENEELNRQLAKLQKDKDSLQTQLNDLQKGLDKVKQAQQTQQEKKDDFDLFREFVTKIKELVTSIKRK